MGIFGPQRLRCAKGVWTTVIDNSFVQIPREFRLTVDGEGAPVEGTLEEKKSRWIIPGTPAAMPIAPSMTLYRGWFNTFYRVRILPAHDVLVVIE